jgi:hypothetical protein
MPVINPKGLPADDVVWTGFSVERFCADAKSNTKNNNGERDERESVVKRNEARSRFCMWESQGVDAGEKNKNSKDAWTSKPRVVWLNNSECFARKGTTKGIQKVNAADEWLDNIQVVAIMHAKSMALQLRWLDDSVQLIIELVFLLQRPLDIKEQCIQLGPV